MAGADLDRQTNVAARDQVAKPRHVPAHLRPARGIAIGAVLSILIWLSILVLALRFAG